MRSVWIVIAGSVFLALGWSQSPADRLEFENQWVRIMRGKMGAHENGARHRRPEPGGVVVFLTDQNIRETSEDGSTRVTHHKAGDVMWSPASAHQDENLSDAPYEYVEIEPKGSAGGAAAPPAAADNKLEAAIVDPKHYHVEFENDLVRVIRFPMAPHDKTAMHTHPPTGAVIVALTDQNTRQTVADGTTRAIRHKAGEAWWGAPNIAHQDENAGDTQTVVIRIELKQAR